jgi:hypothetical protein
MDPIENEDLSASEEDQDLVVLRRKAALFDRISRIVDSLQPATDYEHEYGVEALKRLDGFTLIEAIIYTERRGLAQPKENLPERHFCKWCGEESDHCDC